MKSIFGFFLRLLAAFLLAKAVLGPWGANTPGWLLGSSLGLVLSSYLLSWWRRSRTAEDLDWYVARKLIAMNQLPERKLPLGSPPREASEKG
jgi:hypothetical protein